MLFLFLLATCAVCTLSKSAIHAEIETINQLQPLISTGRVFFWRPQKVGSSTILSILLSYSYRYNIISRRKGGSNAFCLKIASCLASGDITLGNRGETKALIRALQKRKYTSTMLMDQPAG